MLDYLNVFTFQIQLSQTCCNIKHSQLFFEIVFKFYINNVLWKYFKNCFLKLVFSQLPYYAYGCFFLAHTCASLVPSELSKGLGFLRTIVYIAVSCHVLLGTEHRSSGLLTTEQMFGPDLCLFFLCGH